MKLLAICTLLLLPFALVLPYACSGHISLTAPPFAVGSSVRRSYRPEWIQLMPVGKGIVPIIHPAEWRTTFDSEFGLFSLAGQGWYEWADGKSLATIEVSAVYTDTNGDGSLSPTEVTDYVIVGVRDGQEIRKP